MTVTADELSYDEQLALVQRTTAIEITWLPGVKDYAAMWGMSPEDVEQIINAKGRCSIDAHTADVGHLVVRYYAGDVIIIVGYRRLRHPKVMSVFIEGGMPDTSSGSKTPSKGGSDAPTSIRALTKKILDAGYRVEHAGRSSGHLRVINAETGAFLMTIPSTPSDHRTVPNTWSEFLRKDARAKFDEE